WNHLHNQLFLLFYYFIGVHDPGKEVNGLRYSLRAHSLWHAVRSDSGQRDLLAAAATGMLSTARMKSLLWLLECTRKIGADRNALIHANVTSGGLKLEVEIVPDRLAHPQHYKRLSSKDSDRDWKRLTDDLDTLSMYASRIWHSLNFRGTAIDVDRGGRFYTWPQRPRLRAVEGSIRERESPQKRRRRAKRQPPLRSSRG
ncbi:MAG TPA: hypothetical protein VJR87_12065, partial [Allosphingosinicella sp.]|nr:hypothetical protein [Allosphingosinicella sp.]